MMLSIIIPVFNEIKTISTVIDNLNKLPINKEIIIVDDASTDGTKQLLDQLSRKDKQIRLFLNKKNGGKGLAIRTAIPKIKGDYVIIQDADLEYNPDDIVKIIQFVKKTKATVVYGSRFMGNRENMVFFHTLGNRLLTLITNLLYGTRLTDMETCYKLIRTDILKKIKLNCRKFEFEPEITAKILKMGIKIYEIPISYAGRAYHDGKKITWFDGFPAIFTLIKYRFIN